jgi:hypothetical protein
MLFYLCISSSSLSARVIYTQAPLLVRHSMFVDQLMRVLSDSGKNAGTNKRMNACMQTSVQQFCLSIVLHTL